VALRIAAPPTQLLIPAFWGAAASVAVMALIPAPPDVPVSDKALHMIAFAVLASLASNAYYRTSLLRIGLGLASFGGIIEVLHSIPALNRTASAIDLLAGCAAVAVVLGVMHLRN
jgi:hypothetical protein